MYNYLDFLVLREERRTSIAGGVGTLTEHYISDSTDTFIKIQKVFHFPIKSGQLVTTSTATATNNNVGQLCTFRFPLVVAATELPMTAKMIGNNGHVHAHFDLWVDDEMVAPFMKNGDTFFHVPMSNDLTFETILKQQPFDDDWNIVLGATLDIVTTTLAPIAIQILTNIPSRPSALGTLFSRMTMAVSGRGKVDNGEDPSPSDDDISTHSNANQSTSGSGDFDWLRDGEEHLVGGQINWPLDNKVWSPHKGGSDTDESSSKRPLW